MSSYSGLRENRFLGGKAVLAILLAAQLVLLAYQVRSPDASGVRLIRRWSVEAILPAERAAQQAVSGTRDWFANHVDLRHVRQDNAQLRRQLGALTLENERLREQVRELPQLDALLGFQRSYRLQTLAAQVISSGASADAQAIYVSRGSGAGLRRNMAVITPQGVVGKVSQVLKSSAQVLLVTDPDSGVGALIGAAGVHGILVGMGAGRAEVRNVLKGEPAPNGAAVVTSGEDQVYPKGLPLGTVTGSKPSPDGVFKTVSIKLAADLGRLSEVLVVTGTLPPATHLPDADVTAAEIREQHLPTLPAPGSGSAGKGTAASASPAPASFVVPVAAPQPKPALKPKSAAAPSAAPPAKTEPGQP